MFAELVDYIQQNPLIILLACYLAYSFWRARQPIAEPGDPSARPPAISNGRVVTEPVPAAGSKVRLIKTREEWTAAHVAARASGALLMVDFFANWCPPCRSNASYAHNRAQLCASACLP